MSSGSLRCSLSSCSFALFRWERRYSARVIAASLLRGRPPGARGRGVPGWVVGWGPVAAVGGCAVRPVFWLSARYR